MHLPSARINFGALGFQFLFKTLNLYNFKTLNFLKIWYYIPKLIIFLKNFQSLKFSFFVFFLYLILVILGL